MEPHPAPTAPTFTQLARRRQLVDAAIALIAEIGLPAASTVQIALRAGVSRGVLTHHFTDRDDLLDAVVAEVYELGRAAIVPAMEAAAGPRDALLAFVGGSVDLYARYPAHLVALREIFAARRRGGTDGRAHEPLHARELRDLAELLRAGQDEGELRAFEPDTMAAVIRGVLDAALVRIQCGAPAAPLRAEIVRVVDAATGMESA